MRSAEERVAELQRELHVLRSRYDDLHREREADRARFEAWRGARKAAKPQELEGHLPADVEMLAGGHPITKADWREMPGRHKAAILRARTARRAGWVWMGISTAIAAFVVAVPFLNFASGRQFSITMWMALALEVIATFLSFRPWLTERKERAVAAVKIAKTGFRDAAWDDHAAVVWAKSISVHALFHGLPVAGEALGIGGVVSTLGLAMIMVETNGLTLLLGARP